MGELLAVTCDACGEPTVPDREQAEFARLRTLLLELGRLAEGAGALAALCAVLRRAARDARDRLAGVDSEPPGMLTIGEV